MEILRAEQGEIVLSPAEQLVANINALVGDATSTQVIRNEDLELTAPNGEPLKAHRLPYTIFTQPSRTLNPYTGRDHEIFSAETVEPYLVLPHVWFERSNKMYYAVDIERGICTINTTRQRSKKLYGGRLKQLADSYAKELWVSRRAAIDPQRTAAQKVLDWLGLGLSEM